MTTIKASTKKGMAMLERASYNEGFKLWDVYGTVSQAKQNAWEYCLSLCNRENGTNFRIISHNTFSFSIAWDVADGVRIETAQNSYFVQYN